MSARAKALLAAIIAQLETNEAPEVLARIGAFLEGSRKLREEGLP